MKKSTLTTKQLKGVQHTFGALAITGAQAQMITGGGGDDEEDDGTQTGGGGQVPPPTV